MKKSELIQELIEIEKERDPNEKATITMGYIHYLENLKKVAEIGDVEL